jgi:hypothetical protein
MAMSWCQVPACSVWPADGVVPLCRSGHGWTTPSSSRWLRRPTPCSERRPRSGNVWRRPRRAPCRPRPACWARPVWWTPAHAAAGWRARSRHVRWASPPAAAVWWWSRWPRWRSRHVWWWARRRWASLRHGWWANCSLSAAAGHCTHQGFEPLPVPLDHQGACYTEE